MPTKSKVIITKNHVINILRFMEENDAVSHYAHTYGTEGSNSIALFTTSNIASFHSNDNGTNWTLSQNAIGPFGLVQYIAPGFQGRAVGLVNRDNSNSTITTITTKPTVKKHSDYQDSHPDEKTYFSGCMVRPANEEELDKLLGDDGWKYEKDRVENLAKPKHSATPITTKRD